MPRIWIDGRETQVPDGTTVLDAARTLGIDIPTLCWLQGMEPSTSCMACVVKIRGHDRLVPSCATKATDGMSVESQTPEIRRARAAAIELLLSDHLGDCEAPCQSICPGGLDIPRMIRQVAGGDLSGAIATVKRDIALPAVLGRICSAPCEKGCRRARHDAPLAICLLKRFVADADLASAEPYLPACRPSSGKRLAVVGAGPAGLAAAWHLQQAGGACTVFDDQAQPGGSLRRGPDPKALPQAVLDAEIDLVRRLGVQFVGSTRVGRDIKFSHLRGNFDAVVLACGKLDGQALSSLTGGEVDDLKADRTSLSTALPGVFVAGETLRSCGRLAVLALADGKAAAEAVAKFLAGSAVTGPRRRFSCHLGQVSPEEMNLFLRDASPAGRVVPAAGVAGGLDVRQAKAEARRCLHCDCRKADNCRLRDWADALQVRASRYKGQRRQFEQVNDHPTVVYESGKCIDCGICVAIAQRQSEPLGLAFIGRGFSVRVGVPFNDPLGQAIGKAAAACVAACPTGALAFKEE